MPAAIQTTHVGSLIRPDDVVAAMRRIARGEEVDAGELQSLLEPAVRAVVRRQKEVGVDIVSDGEYGKIGWNFYVYERLGGIELRPPQAETFGDLPISATDWERFPEFYAEYFRAEQDFETPQGTFAAVDAISYTGGAAIERDIANLKAAMAAEGVEEGFLPVVAPASCFPSLIDEHYGSERAALMGIAEALREEYRAIADAGLYVQVDDAFVPFMYDVLVPPGTMEDYLVWAQPRIDAVNHALRGSPPSACATTSAGGAGTARTPTTSRCATSCRWSFRSGRGRSFSRTQTRATSTSGGSGRTSSCRRACGSPPA